MSAISNVVAIKEIDKLVAVYLALSPSLTAAAPGATTPGFGDNTIAKGAGTDYGAQLKLRDLETILLATTDPARIKAQFAGIETAIVNIAKQNQIQNIFGNLLVGLAGDMNGAGLSTSGIDAFLSYYNTGAGGSWQALAPPDWKDLVVLAGQAAPNPFNVYAPPQLATAGLGTVATSALTPGTAVDTTKYAGHVQIFGVVTSTITVTTSSDTIKLSANGFTANGTANAPTPFTGSFASHQLTSQSLAVGTYTSGTILNFGFVSANDIITAITGVQYGGNVTGVGAFWIGGLGPVSSFGGVPSGLTGTNIPSSATRLAPPT